MELKFEKLGKLPDDLHCGFGEPDSIERAYIEPAYIPSLVDAVNTWRKLNWEFPENGLVSIYRLTFNKDTNPWDNLYLVYEPVVYHNNYQIKFTTWIRYNTGDLNEAVDIATASIKSIRIEEPSVKNKDDGYKLALHTYQDIKKHFDILEHATISVVKNMQKSVRGHEWKAIDLMWPEFSFKPHGRKLKENDGSVYASLICPIEPSLIADYHDLEKKRLELGLEYVESLEDSGAFLVRHDFYKPDVSESFSTFSTACDPKMYDNQRYYHFEAIIDSKTHSGNVKNPNDAISLTHFGLRDVELKEKFKAKHVDQKPMSRKIARAELEWLKKNFETRYLFISVFFCRTRSTDKVTKRKWHASEVGMPEMKLAVQRPRSIHVINLEWEKPRKEVVALTNEAAFRIGEQLYHDLEEDGDYLIGHIEDYHLDESFPAIRILKKDYDKLLNK